MRLNGKKPSVTFFENFYLLGVQNYKGLLSFRQSRRSDTPGNVLKAAKKWPKLFQIESAPIEIFFIVLLPLTNGSHFYKNEDFFTLFGRVGLFSKKTCKDLKKNWLNEKSNLGNMFISL